jgi:hypothetical protein
MHACMSCLGTLTVLSLESTIDELRRRLTEREEMYKDLLDERYLS